MRKHFPGISWHFQSVVMGLDTLLISFSRNNGDGALKVISFLSDKPAEGTSAGNESLAWEDQSARRVEMAGPV
jgi:hypothetical protein